ncbi:ATP-binding protein [Streptomyces sp. NPDC051662]|uniref:ATP-binding protein n=1 Tax=Streptomyces sp. NPDC051662 TaxID=3154750 RepID=UPI00343957B7
MARYTKVDLLCLDEFGYANLDKKGAKLLFQIFTEREERKATAVATNSPFAEWDKTFGNRRLCAAIADRITFRCSLIQTGTESSRHVPLGLVLPLEEHALPVHGLHRIESHQHPVAQHEHGTGKTVRAGAHPPQRLHPIGHMNTHGVFRRGNLILGCSRLQRSEGSRGVLHKP